MKNAGNDIAEKILRDALKHSHVLYKEVLAALEKEFKKYAKPNAKRIRQILLKIFRKYIPAQAQLLGDAVVAAVLAGNQAMLSRVGLTAAAPKEKLPPDVFDPFGYTRKRYPIIENAVRHLGGRKAVSSSLFYRAKPEARRYALFTVKHLSQKAVVKVQEALLETLDTSTSLPQFKKLLEESFKVSPLGPGHCENVYRTAVSQAFSEGNWTAHDENHYVKLAMPYCRFWCIHDARVRHTHLQFESCGIDGTNWFRADDPIIRLFQTPLEFNCFVPDTEVHGKFNAGFRSFYSGQIVQITTSAGRRLTVTPNHPILTRKGFRPAKELIASRDEALCYRRWNDRIGNSHDFSASPDYRMFSLPSEYEYYVPAKIEQIFSALKNFGFERRSPVRRNYFHSDGNSCKGYVYAVATSRNLLNDICASDSKLFGNLIFPQMNSVSSGSTGNIDFMNCFVGNDSALGSLPSCAALSFNFGSVALEAGPFDFLLFGSGSRIDSSRYDVGSYDSSVDSGAIVNREYGFSGDIGFNQRLVDNYSRPSLAVYQKNRIFDSSNFCESSSLEVSSDASPTDSDFIADLFQRFSGLVFFDQIVDVRQCDFSGHVYDLQSEGGWIIADGIFCSNCRCGMTWHTKRQAAERGVKEAQEWVRTGIDPKRAYVKMPKLNPMPIFVADRLRSREGRQSVQLSTDDGWYSSDSDAATGRIERGILVKMG